MDPRERPTGRHFLLRPLELERIRALKGTPFYEERLRRARAATSPMVREPLQPWDSGDNRFAWYNHDRYHAMLNLTMLYLLTGEAELAQACRRDAMTIVQVSEKHPDRILSVDYIQETYINRTLLFAHEWLSEFFTLEERERIKQTCIRCMPHHAWEMARSTVNQKLIQNHLQHDSTGMALVALYFNDFNDAERWGLFAAETSVRYVRDAFHPDGAQNELATSYHACCLDLAILISLVLRDFGQRDLMREPWFRGVLERGLDWMASLLTPAGTFVPFNDSREGVESWFFRFGAFHFASSHFQAVADCIDRHSQGVHLLFDLLHYDPSLPARFNPDARRVFPVSGTAVMRSGHGEQDGMLAQKVGSYIGGHAHRDRLGFAYWHAGRCLLPDSGSGISDHQKERDLFDGYFKQTSSHNVVAIHEPHTQTIEVLNRELVEFPMEHRNHKLAQGRILEAREEPAFGVLVSTASIYDGVRQQRSLVWHKPSGALLVADWMEAEAEHPFDQIFHGHGALEIEGRAFTFRDPTCSLAGSLLHPGNGEVVRRAAPERVAGDKLYAASHARGKSVFFVTLLEPFVSQRPPLRTLDAKGNLVLDLAGTRVTLALQKNRLAVRIGEEDVLSG